jgi:phenol 2-monooxygenase (NADPH)
MTGARGGKAYASFGIGSPGAIIIVRPDGHVGFIGQLDCRAVQDTDNYFSSFMKAPR